MRFGRHIVAIVSALVVLLADASAALAGNGGFAPVSPESPNADGISQSWWFVTAFVFGIFLLVEVLLVLFVVRYREIFFGMLNLAFSMVLWSLLEKMFHYTNGADGIRVARPGLLGFSFTPETFQYVILYVSLLVAVIAFYGVQRYLDSPLGHMLRAMKSNETRLEYLGMSARRVLLIGYVISAFLGGIGGTLVSIIQQIATPEFGFWTKSGEFVFIAILGGGAHAFGAFAGAAMFECVRFYAAAHLADSWQLILGVVLIVIILYAPNGLIGLRQRYGQSRQGGH